MKKKSPHIPSQTHVALLMGGWNCEREVSLSTGKGFLDSLKRQGYQVRSLDLKRDMAKLVHFLTPKPDIVLLALHGSYVEDGRLQGILDIMDIPYAPSSGALASALAYNKPLAKQLFKDAGIPCAKGGVFLWKDIQDTHPMHTPYVIKPIDEGSSVGVYIIEEGQPPIQNKIKWDFGDKVLVEEYIPGYELSCAVLGNEPLAVIELRAKSGFYDYKNKYTDNMTDHLIPAPIPKDVYDRVMDYSLRAHHALGCESLSRSDFRYNPEKGDICILELNTLPGCTPLSIVPDICRYKGISFDNLIFKLIEDRLCRA
jgi:D-alanine-D-alanine ligase